jgi:hypothetical protein
MQLVALRMALIRMKLETTFERQKKPIVWPDKCNIVSVISKTNIEIPTLASEVSRAVSGPQTTTEVPQAFGATLLEASRKLSKSDIAKDSSPKVTSRQKSSSEDASSQGSVADGHITQLPLQSQETAVPPQVKPLQPAPITNSDFIPIQAPCASPAPSLGGSNLVGDGPMDIVAAERVKGAESSISQTGETQSAKFPLQASTKCPELAGEIANGPAGSLSKPGHLASTAFVKEAPNALQEPLRDEAGKANSSETHDLAPSGGLNAGSSASAAADPAPALRVSLDASQNGTLPSTLPTISTDQAVPTTFGHDVSACTATGPTNSSVATSQAGAVVQQGGGLPGSAQPGTMNQNSSPVVQSLTTNPANARDESKTAINALAGPKQHVQSLADEAGTKAGSHDAGSSGDQTRGGNSSQDQIAAPAQMNFAVHSATVIAHAQGSDIGPVMQSAPTNAVGAGSAGRVPVDSAPITTALPQALPAINTARLIQSIGQSEIRVGMRTNEFGNISINTSATRNSISAQISVDHGELAKAIAANLPEMQARLGGNQALSVRVDMNGAGIGQGTGTFSGMPNDTPDQSRSGGRQEGNPASGYSGSGFADRPFPLAAAAMTTGEDRLNGRLDVRV